MEAKEAMGQSEDFDFVSFLFLRQTIPQRCLLDFFSGKHKRTVFTLCRLISVLKIMKQISQNSNLIMHKTSSNFSLKKCSL